MYLGFFQEHLWALLHIENNDKPDEATTKQRTTWVQSDRDKCALMECQNMTISLYSVVVPLTQTDTGDEGFDPVFPLDYPQPRWAFFFFFLQNHSHINVGLFIS